MRDDEIHFSRSGTSHFGKLTTEVKTRLSEDEKADLMRASQSFSERDDGLPALPERCLVHAVAQARNDRLRSADDGADFRVAHAVRGDLEEGGFDVHASL